MGDTREPEAPPTTWQRLVRDFRTPEPAPPDVSRRWEFAVALLLLSLNPLALIVTRQYRASISIDFVKSIAVPFLSITTVTGLALCFRGLALYWKPGRMETISTGSIVMMILILPLACAAPIWAPYFLLWPLQILE